MFADLARLPLLALAGVGLWTVWRTLRPDPVVSSIVGTGFVLRAVLGAALFWISYLALPLGESLQLGNGLWFIAQDAQIYVSRATQAAAGGLAGVMEVSNTEPSVAYIRVLALTMWLVGSQTSAALLVNLAAYLATCSIIGRLAAVTRASRAVVICAIAAVSLSPASILWATQPLKDTLFLALVAAYVLALDTALRAWSARSHRTLLASAAALWACLYMVAGIRWYFALMLLCGTALALLIVWLFRAHGRRMTLTLAAGVGLLVLGQAVTIGAGAYLPSWGHFALQPWTGSESLASWRNLPREAVAVADRSRLGLSAAGGGTEILMPSSAEPGGLTPEGPAVPGMPQFERPDTPLEKIATGALAMFVPRAVGQGLGLITIGGGRGLWLFADLDTLVLDVIVIVALVLVSRQIAAGRQPQPVFWAVLSVTLMMAVSLAYQGSNFGTLFRQRGMVALGLMLLPLLTGPEGGRRTPDATVRT